MPFKFSLNRKISWLLFFFSLTSSDSLTNKPETKWPQAIVKYQFAPSLNLNGMAQVKKIFETFESKTCLRFQPRETGDKKFVSFEVDNNATCSSTYETACEEKGHQKIKLGENCNVIQSLGLSLCLSYEHKRVDRDRYIKFQDQCPNKSQADTKLIPKGIYDYESQWHGLCNTCQGGWPTNSGVTNCGQNGSSRLSVLDVDKINSLYNCQGCNRHRWIHIRDLTHTEKANMHNFGYETIDGSPLYPCRARVFGSIVVGKYDDLGKRCYIYYYDSNTFIEELDNFEVLTIPGGPNSECSIYKLSDPFLDVLNIAVTAGAWNKDYKWEVNVAFASFKTNATNNSTNERSVGHIWVKDGRIYKRSAYAVLGDFKVVTTRHFQILTCSQDKTCMLNQLYAKNTLNECK